jgi:hypothetical protein
MIGLPVTPFGAVHPLNVDLAVLAAPCVGQHGSMAGKREAERDRA